MVPSPARLLSKCQRAGLPLVEISIVTKSSCAKEQKMKGESRVINCLPFLTGTC